ncbi:uracil-DNA glycosylase family protein [Gryllotalpicola koreensis]|uniref:Uracil-DNA glycosylase-like domain-containing protein n=1 Tax=Gryllotalpicola koreensis TaxID=993086 RepID=A0ABP8A5R6_9MICO
MTLIGYQCIADWMGDPVLTLADLWPEHPRAMIVGLNPAPVSVAAGHYYQGQTGQRQLSRLVEAGVFARPVGHAFEESALAAGIGFTDIVKRPTKGEGGVSAIEIEQGRRALRDKLAACEVPLVICVFRHPVRALLGAEGAPGVQRHRTDWGAAVFRMPGPFDARDRVASVMAQLPPLLG